MIGKSKKKEEHRPILYQKFKIDHHLNVPVKIDESPVKKGKSIVSRIMDVITLFILIAMIFLSSVGAITLMNPGMKMMLLELF